MKILMNPKIVFTVIAILNIIHGLLLLFGAESMYMEMAPGLSQEAMALGATELEICSAFNFFLAIVLFSCRNLKFPDVKNVLIGTGIGLFCLVGFTFKHTSAYPDYPELRPPTFMIFIFTVIALWSIIAGIKGKTYNLD
tara:strand:- start:26 stop:442 length:417 start_codon:yes stop_codon:yes gene_type:complete